jgi:hypothetical protein
MPVLDARALRIDRKGLAFLREVLRRDRMSRSAVAEERKPAKRVQSRQDGVDEQPRSA